jgi:hypothetical protein
MLSFFLCKKKLDKKPGKDIKIVEHNRHKLTAFERLLRYTNFIY